MAFRYHDLEDPIRKFLLFAEGDGGEGDGGGGGGDGTQGDGGEPAKGAADGGDGKAAAGEDADKGAGNGAAEGDWRASIEDADLRKHAGRFASTADLAKAHLDLRGQLSTAIIPPGKDASDEDTAAYRKALGVPETAEGYKFAVPEGHEPTDADKAFQASAAEAFLANNIPAETAKGLIDWWNERVAQTQQDILDDDTKFAAESEAALKRKWPGEEYARNKAHADKAFRKLFGEDADEARNIETKDGRYLLDQPLLVEALARLGREMPGEGGIDRVMTDGDRDSVQTQIDDLEEQINKAKAAGNREKANNLYQEQLALDAKITGNVPIVGSEGRTV